MPNEIEQLKMEITQLKNELLLLSNKLSNHNHNGADTRQISYFDLFGKRNLDTEYADGFHYYGVDAGANDTYAISITGIDKYEEGLLIYFKANTANTGACTLNINNLGAKALKSLHDQDPANDYIEAGSIVACIYDGTNFQILSTDANP